ncbi:MAG: penicillin-binding protein activator [Thermoproteota archaeon]|nr:penicillin-binding protein activator [Thermoproteota archaeon]
MIDLNRKILFIGLAIAIIASDSIIFFAEAKNRDFYSNWVISANAAIAASLGIFVAYRHRFHGPHAKAHVALSIGLSLWLCAEVTWAIYEIVLEIIPPIPSIADYLWLSAYGFLAYYLFSTYREFKTKLKFSKKTLIISIIVSAIFAGYVIYLTTSISFLSSQRDIAMFIVTIAYPTLDAILMVPAIVILLDIRNEPLWFIPWICESLGLLLIALSDSWFALVVLTSLTEQFWLSSLFFAAHFLVMAAGLVWYIKFIILPSSQAEETTIRNDLKISRKNNSNYQKVVTGNNKRRIGRRTYVILVSISFIGIVITYSLYPPLYSQLGGANTIVIPAPNNSKHPVTLGALLSINGASSSVGESEEAGLRLAVRDVNDYFSKTNSDIRIGLVVEDTHTDPSRSLEELKDLAAKGIRIVIGPSTSAELEAIKDYANNNGIILLSPSSTAPLLATSGDNIFRLVPDDTHQAEAIATQMWKDGIRVVVPIWRSDVYGNHLVRTMKVDFKKLGGTVVDGVGYFPPIGHFSTSLNRINLIIWNQQLSSLSSKLIQAIAQYGANKVGVYLVAFDEVTPILIQAQDHPEFSRVKWYGSDGTALNNGLIKNIDAAIFAEKTAFLNPIYRVEPTNTNSTRYNDVQSEIQNMIGRIPRSYASVAYDSLWLAALTENAALRTMMPNDVNFLKKTFVHIADSYSGITGNTALNTAGDRSYGNYDFWAIKQGTNGAFTWQLMNKDRSNLSNNNNEMTQENNVPTS